MRFQFPFMIICLAALAACQSDSPSTTAGHPVAAVPAAAPVSGPPADIADLVGARAAGGETALQSRGYTSARTQGLTAFWWNANSRTCARVTTAQGRYAEVMTAAPSDCGM
ncbi:hypothetical protein [Arvimicrobium flavum]|uniref:hypothetical protein n=1 Tax=Arvimicrobium flavum TaxID=3393320 RepID=UPI00237B37A4|nr:hypothetical protein [Mesorhizobium shangrilense]